MIKRHKTKSCCGSQAYIFETQMPVMRQHLDAFKKEGFAVPAHFEKSGVFYVELKGLVATTSFGGTKVQVRCHSANCPHLMNTFANILDRLTAKNA